MSSTLYTIGTALGRAKDHGVVVRVLVAGAWIEGMVSAVDGHGVVLAGSGSEHHVIRVEAISAVLVNVAEPLRDDIPDTPCTYVSEEAQVRDFRLPVMAGYDS